MYERFSPQDPNGVADQVNGIREFIVGTGGGNLTEMSGVIKSNSEAQAQVWGVLMLVLHAADYRWQFVSVDGTASDVGQTTCH